jgi:hypothetical protein
MTPITMACDANTYMHTHMCTQYTRHSHTTHATHTHIIHTVTHCRCAAMLHPKPPLLLLRLLLALL